MKQWEMVIGLEVHIQLNTQSKAFCGDANQFGALPNSLTSVVSLAHPGTLPRINKAQIQKAMRLGLALNCSIAQTTFFDRKNYFYPDLPKGYQITQDTQPICMGGHVDLTDRKIRLHHIHMEEDAGKSIHDLSPTATLIDLNRAGVPLLELVTEPDFRSADEVEEFLTGLRSLVRWLEVSDGNMEEGSLRCDVNLSLREMGTEAYGTRCEIKNLNSMRFARQAIAYERKRQTELLNKGEKIIQQTRQFVTSKGITLPLRDKEEAHDYRYFPDPDLPPLHISDAALEEAKASLPELPKAIKARWVKEFGLKKNDLDQLTQGKLLAETFERLANQTKHPIELSQLMVNKIIPHVKSEAIPLEQIPAKGILEFVSLLAEKKVAKSVAYQRLFPGWMEAPTASPKELAASLGLLLAETDSSALDQLLTDLLAAHPVEVANYKKGKKNLLGFFMGELMKQSKGQIDPAAARAALLKALT